MKRKPNLLIIMSDQHRYDCTGASGDYPVRTPNIDRIAQEGTWFTNAYTPLPVCGPARGAFVCGRRPESFGAYWNDGITLPVASLTAGDYSWARALQAAGYRNGYIGKWGASASAAPTAFGYDHYLDADKVYAEFRAAKYPSFCFTGGFLGEPDPVPLDDSPTHWLAEQASRMIEQLAGEGDPWHIRVNFSEPHLPCRPAAPFAKMYDPAAVPRWRSFGETFTAKPYIQRQQLVNWGIEQFEWEDWAPIVARYYGIISQMDDAIGKILLALSRLGLEHDTIVIYTSDHGDLCGGHRMLDKHYVMYDDLVKVPLAIRWPGVIAPQQRCDAFVHHVLDLPPTILEWIGEKAPEHFHGRSLLPLLQGELPADWRTAAVSTYNGQQFGLFVQRMIRTNSWKYVWNPTDRDELYDLAGDPDELVNRVSDPECTEVLAALRKALYEELKQAGDGIVRGSWLEGQLLANRKL
ncbi:sulfatase-like hydrolase/transferase [Paenibacillus sp. GCM10027626]|uniref:sulfatase-like hydrolase/transferase n=1 Tax=Paenibacillus sp. GCM10027626 TaxID=3273411 RepID=UPI00363B0DE5